MYKLEEFIRSEARPGNRIAVEKEFRSPSCGKFLLVSSRKRKDSSKRIVDQLSVISYVFLFDFSRR